MNKLLIISGPTASGKTALALKLAEKFNGEIISCDSRQIYRKMNIVIGKDTGNSEFKIQNSELKRKIQKEINLKIKLGIYQLDDIVLWGLDLVSPDQEFSVSHWIKFSQLVIKDVWSRKKLPVIAGGAGFWIKSLLQPPQTTGIIPDRKLREELSQLSVEELQKILKKNHSERIQRMNQSDKNNPRRLMRAIEVAKASNLPNLPNLPKANFLIIGLKADNKFLYQRIDQRVDKRIKQGAKKEVDSLIKKGYSLDLLSMSGIGYKQLAAFLSKKISEQEAIQTWKYNEHAYSRRQLTFLKKIKDIHWFRVDSPGWQQEVVKLIKNWYAE